MENVKYIPGDLVKDKYQSNEIFEVTNTSKYGYMLKSIENDVIINSTTETLIGIPLTPQILEENGWKQAKHIVENDGYEYYLYKNKSNLFPEIQYYPKGDWNKEDEFSIFWGDTEVRPDIHYLHELQHLLFGLGLDSSLKV